MPTDALIKGQARRRGWAALWVALAALLGFEGSASLVLGDDWSPEYRASLRRTIERRKERRRSLGQVQGDPFGAGQGAGTIVPYPLPPSLIIRQTPETHDEIGGLLHLLRGS